MTISGKGLMTTTLSPIPRLSEYSLTVIADAGESSMLVLFVGAEVMNDDDFGGR